MERDGTIQNKYRLQLLSYLTLACGISWIIWAPLWLPAFGIQGLPQLPFHHALGASGPILAAFVVSAKVNGLQGPSELLHRMVLWQGRQVWIAIALLAPIALFLLAATSAFIFAGEPFSFQGFGRASEFPQFTLIGFLIYNILSFGYGEEVGWRGFALPRLQKQYSALTATLLLTLAWALWHLPLFFYRPGYMGMNVAGVTGWLFSLTTGSLLLTWLYNSSRGSVLVVALFHATVDLVFTSDMSSDPVINTLGLLITVWGIGVLVIAGPKYLSKEGKMIFHRDHQQITKE